MINRNPCIYGQTGMTGVDAVMPIACPATATDVGGVVFGGTSVNNNLSRKRSRPDLSSSSILGEVDMSSQIYNHMLDVDRLIVQHVVSAANELSRKRRRFSSEMIAAVNECVLKQLKAKEEEIEELRRLNWGLEERIKSVEMENNAWRYLAQTHEATAATLRANLEHLLLADQANEAEVAADDAESFCGDNFLFPAGQYDHQAAETCYRCRNCRNGESSVLLLPCRHLCLCSACGPAMDACPICKCTKTGTVNVNLC